MLQIHLHTSFLLRDEHLYNSRYFLRVSEGQDCGIALKKSGIEDHKLFKYNTKINCISQQNQRF